MKTSAATRQGARGIGVSRSMLMRGDDSLEMNHKDNWHVGQPV